MQALATIPTARGKLIADPIRGHRVGWFPSSGLIFAEGHPGGDRLGSAEMLPEVLVGLEEALHDHGVPVGLRPSRSRPDRQAWDIKRDSFRGAGFAGIRRMDVTCDLSFDSGAEGLAVLAGVAAMDLPRMKQAIWRTGGSVGMPAHGESARLSAVETVAFYGHAGKKMLARWYDKGIESGDAPRGQLIRPEDQRRYTAASRRDVGSVTGQYVRDMFRQRFAPLWQATKGITVGGPGVLAAELGERVATGDLSMRQAERIAGFMMLTDNGHWQGSRSTFMRRRREMREAGVVMADGVLDEVEVDLHAVLGEAMESPAWGAQG